MFGRIGILGDKKTRILRKGKRPITVEGRLFKPTEDGWYKHSQDRRHYIEMRLMVVEGVEWLSIIVSREDEVLKEYFSVRLDKFLKMLRGDYESEEDEQGSEECREETEQTEIKNTGKEGEVDGNGDPSGETVDRGAA